jgi:hypothetical protein
MMAWAQTEVGNTAWPIPGKCSTTELRSPRVISLIHCGAVLESNMPDRMSVGTVLKAGLRLTESDLPNPQSSHSRNIKTDSASPGIADLAWDSASSGVVQVVISWQ